MTAAPRPAGVFALDANVDADVEEVADLHAQYLADSPVVVFGDVFLRRFYYGTLVRDELVRVVMCRVDGHVAGFFAYALDPLAFMTAGIRRHPFTLAWILARSVLRHPSLVGKLMMMSRMMRDRAREASGEVKPNTGEVLSLVVDRAHGRHVPPGGTSRITNRLFEVMIDRCREAGLERVQFMVQPDNLASNLFCSSLGCSMKRIRHAGHTVHRYTYEIQPPS
jgi:hypothetical protein